MIVLAQLNGLREKVDNVAVYEILRAVAADVNLSIQAINVAQSLTLPTVDPKISDLAAKLSPALIYEAVRTLRASMNGANARVQAPFLVLAQIEQMRLWPLNPAYVFETCRGLINGANILAAGAGR